jgi:deazaflavin-dependent oxidoreductase (nitroreductase family)
VTTVKHRLTRAGNQIGLFLHRIAKGRLDARGDTTVLMITCPGRRTGQPRSTMVRYLEYDGGYLVWGTGSGSATEPDWFRNLRRAGEAWIEIGTRPHRVRIEILDGRERDHVWHDIVLRAAPGVEKYAVKTGRTIPIAVLRPIDATEPDEARKEARPSWPHQALDTPGP